MNDALDYQGFLFFPSIRESIDALPTRQGRELLWAVTVFGTERKIIPCTKAVHSVLLSIIPNITCQQARYRQKVAAMEKAEEEKPKPPIQPGETKRPLADETARPREKKAIEESEVPAYFEEQQ